MYPVPSTRYSVPGTRPYGTRVAIMKIQINGR